MQEAKRESKKLFFLGKETCGTFPKFVINLKIFSVDRVTKAKCLCSDHFQKQMKTCFSFHGILFSFIKTPLVKAYHLKLCGVLLFENKKNNVQSGSMEVKGASKV